MKNYYDILRVRPNASQEQIKDAYIELISKYHPDIYSGDKKYAEDYTAMLTEAYSVLKDPVKRQDYDVSEGIVVNYTSTSYSNDNLKNYKNNNEKFYRKSNLEQEESRKHFKSAKINKSRQNIFKRIFKSKLFYALLFVFGIEMLIIIFIYLRS